MTTKQWAPMTDAHAQSRAYVAAQTDHTYRPRGPIASSETLSAWAMLKLTACCALGVVACLMLWVILP